MSTGTTTPPAGAGAGPSTTRREGVTVEPGDVVLVLLEPGIRRPLMIAKVGMVDVHDGMISTKVIGQAFRVSGTLFCEPDDHTTLLFRTKWSDNGDPARVTGRPDRLMPLCYVENLGHGLGIGQWIPRPTKLPSGA